MLQSFRLGIIGLIGFVVSSSLYAQSTPAPSGSSSPNTMVMQKDGIAINLGIMSGCNQAKTHV